MIVISKIYTMMALILAWVWRVIGLRDNFPELFQGVFNQRGTDDGTSSLGHR